MKLDEASIFKRTKGLFDVLAALYLSGCDCQTGLFIAAARWLLCPPTRSNNKHSINGLHLYPPVLCPFLCVLHSHSS